MSSNIVIGAEGAPLQTYDPVYDLSFVTHMSILCLEQKMCIRCDNFHCGESYLLCAITPSSFEESSILMLLSKQSGINTTNKITSYDKSNGSPSLRCWDRLVMVWSRFRESILRKRV